MYDDVRSAFAAFGLDPGAPLTEVRRRYKKLARRWHPDLFVGDPQGLAEATIRMRVINRAYEMIRHAEAARVPRVPEKQTTDSGLGTSVPAGAPLTSDEIEEIVEALNYRPSFVERLREDPFNRVLSLLVVTWYAAMVVSSGMRPVPNFPASWMVLFVCPALLHHIWGDDTSRKAYAWILLLTVTLLLPWFGAVMDSRVFH
jgi:hypothetical protein